MAGPTSGPAPWIIRPAPVVLPPAGPSRTPPRVPALQEPGYLKAFDATTLFYDVFRSGRRVMAVGPPAETLTAYVESLCAHDNSGRAVRFSVEDVDRLGRFWGWRSRSHAQQCLGQITIGEDLVAAFVGRRAVVTVSKNNDLEWIRAWGAWYASRHGADALIVYDNGSSAYSLEQLWEVLTDVPGIAAAAVVAWPFKYGPIAVPPHRLWDSNYAQHGALEHARWRLLRRSAGYLNVDVDELVIDPEGRSVFDNAATRASGATHLRGIWAYAALGTPRDRRPRHSDATWIRAGGVERPCAPKWCVVPSRLPRRSQLTVHRVEGIPMTMSTEFWFWHCHNISTNWDGRRPSSEVSLESHRPDTRLMERFDHMHFNPRPTSALRPPLRSTITYFPMRLRLAAATRIKHLLAPRRDRRPMDAAKEES